MYNSVHCKHIVNYNTSSLTVKEDNIEKNQTHLAKNTLSYYYYYPIIIVLLLLVLLRRKYHKMFIIAIVL